MYVHHDSSRQQKQSLIQFIGITYYADNYLLRYNESTSSSHGWGGELKFYDDRLICHNYSLPPPFQKMHS